MNGILIVNKEENYTSRDIVNKVSKILGTKKIGHTGTLDPMATGVLVLCIGEATKISELLISEDKEYEAEITLGIKTDTLDSTGTILTEKECILDKERIDHILSNMIGSYNQIVPIYSAVKIKGKKLYEYARKKEEVELPIRKVHIYELYRTRDILYSNQKTIFSIYTKVSKGTYIRSLVNDIAESLNTIGVMSKLNRIKQGKFKIEDSFTLKEIAEGNYKILSLEEVLNDLLTVTVDDYIEKKIKNGCLLENRYMKDLILFKNKKNQILAIYKEYEKDNSKIKPWKMFNG